MSDILDDDSFLADLGIEDNSSGKSPDERFYQSICALPMPKIGNLIYWLRHEMARFQYTKGKGILIQREEVKATPKGPTRVNKDVTPQDYARTSIEYYLLMVYLPRFRHTEDHRPLCTMETTLDLIMGNEEVRTAINKRY